MTRFPPTDAPDRGGTKEPVYARTSVLCNGLMAWKIGSRAAMRVNPGNHNDSQEREGLVPAFQAQSPLLALNLLQWSRTSRLEMGEEMTEPLAHVQESLPTAVGNLIYCGGRAGHDLAQPRRHGAQDAGIFWCEDLDFQITRKTLFPFTRRADGVYQWHKGSFYDEMRRHEYLLWPVMAATGDWMAVVAHLVKLPTPSKARIAQPHGATTPVMVPSEWYNAVQEYAIVSPRAAGPGSKTRQAVERVNTRFLEILARGKIKVADDARREIWVPTDLTDFASGLRIFALIKELMLRITEFYCTRGNKVQGHDSRAFWAPMRGWLNVDEVRSEMMGRAASRCLVATGYRTRIAIEGMRREIGTSLVTTLAKELKPRREDYTYVPGNNNMTRSAGPLDWRSADDDGGLPDFPDGPLLPRLGNPPGGGMGAPPTPSGGGMGSRRGGGWLPTPSPSQEPQGGVTSTLRNASSNMGNDDDEDEDDELPQLPPLQDPNSGGGRIPPVAPRSGFQLREHKREAAEKKRKADELENEKNQNAVLPGRRPGGAIRTVRDRVKLRNFMEDHLGNPITYLDSEEDLDPLSYGPSSRPRPRSKRITKPSGSAGTATGASAGARHEARARAEAEARAKAEAAEARTRSRARARARTGRNPGSLGVIPEAPGNEPEDTPSKPPAKPGRKPGPSTQAPTPKRRKQQSSATTQASSNVNTNPDSSGIPDQIKLSLGVSKPRMGPRSKDR
ncbi:hypothetical protein F5Y15DRAFT_426705 [Xylariaceae sp. FL0016]|nr:hypothetical protein F5Y15DRAFT_426705 [Xylariaceae sp. FL0016]